jgi:putative aminopeptidase FrvX
VKLLKELCEAPGVPGSEDAVRKIVVSELKGTCNSVKTDMLGNVIGFKRGRGPARNRRRVMISAHMDEIGFIVSHVDENGFLRVDPVGGINPKTIIAQRVWVFGKKKLHGVIGSKPIHILQEEERKKPASIEEIFIDLGMPGKQVRKLVDVGDPVVLEQSYAEIGEAVCCKALDDRVGVYVMLEAMKKAKGADSDIYAVGSVQEEVGLRGAITSAFDVDPHVGIALDVTLACDVPGAGKHQQITVLGEGAAIKLKDSSSLSNPKLVKKLRDIAKKKKIKHQLEILPRGGTDAGAMQRTRSGVAVCTISIPTRYVHSVVEMAHKDDIKASIELLAAFLNAAHEGDFKL